MTSPEELWPGVCVGGVPFLQTLFLLLIWILTHLYVWCKRSRRCVWGGAPSLLKGRCWLSGQLGGGVSRGLSHPKPMQRSAPPNTSAERAGSSLPSAVSGGGFAESSEAVWVVLLAGQRQRAAYLVLRVTCGPHRAALGSPQGYRSCTVLGARRWWSPALVQVEGRAAYRKLSASFSPLLISVHKRKSRLGKKRFCPLL